MCFELDRFVDKQLAKKLVCSICHYVLCCPQQNQSKPLSKQEPANGINGGHKFCERCIQEWLERDNSCPYCRRALNLDELQPLDWFSCDLLKELKIRCKYYENGCDFVDDLELIKNHELKNCSFKPKKCEQCDAYVTNFKDHLHTDCINHLIQLIKLKDDELKKRDKVNKMLINDFMKANEQIKDLKLNLKEKENEINEWKNESSNLKKTVRELQEIHTIKTEENKELQLHKLCFQYENNYDQIKQLIVKEKANVNYKSKESWTPLIAASQIGDCDIIKLLIDNGADVNYSTDDGWTPLLAASRNGHIKTCKLLIHAGSDLNHREDFGNNAVYWAARNAHYITVELLIRKGCNVNNQNIKGLTPLFGAIQESNIEIVKLLIENGANINQKSNDLLTPLMLASKFGIRIIVKLLIVNRATIDDKDKYGNTALNLASHYNNLDVVKLLVENNANVNNITVFGQTPYKTALFKEYQEIAKYLQSKGGF